MSHLNKPSLVTTLSSASGNLGHVCVCSFYGVPLSSLKFHGGVIEGFWLQLRVRSWLYLFNVSDLFLWVRACGLSLQKQSDSAWEIRSSIKSGISCMTTTLEPPWNHLGTTLEPPWNHLGTTLEPPVKELLLRHRSIKFVRRCVPIGVPGKWRTQMVHGEIFVGGRHENKFPPTTVKYSKYSSWCR